MTEPIVTPSSDGAFPLHVIVIELQDRPGSVNRSATTSAVGARATGPPGPGRIRSSWGAAMTTFAVEASASTKPSCSASLRGDAAYSASSRSGTTDVASAGSSLRAAAEPVTATPSCSATRSMTCASPLGASQYPRPGLVVAYP